MNIDREFVIARLVWDDRAQDVAAQWGLGVEDVVAIIRHDDQPTVDPHSTDVNHLIVRFRSGDIVVVVGFRDPDAPKVLHVHNTAADRAHDRLGATAGALRGGTGPGSSLPTSHRELKRRILKLGYRLAVSGSGHLAVVDPDTDRRIAWIGSTPSPSGIANDWKRFLRAHNNNTKES